MPYKQVNIINQSAYCLLKIKIKTIYKCVNVHVVLITLCHTRVYKTDCLLPIKTGPCRGGFRRYAYDSSEDKCVEFIYGGCQANANNFETIEECEAACLYNTCECSCP
uniref:BPTI/Kunitz inhibitor domain-containing protein n=1 Tax=Bombyx mori TaxID=7091 RepID=A0A8R2MAB3_BOMMO|nr:kunitz-type serine protease inhibitor nigrescinin-4-like isoform X1 [Bombyx mori]